LRGWRLRQRGAGPLRIWRRLQGLLRNRWRPPEVLLFYGDQWYYSP
jgi:hypothetical protein